MKSKIILFIFFLLINIPVYAQATLVFKLVESDGTTPNTGEAANISFTVYPHSYPTNVLGGITVTESGTTGTYKAKTFTTYQYVKMWLSGVEYTAFDSIQVGNILTYLQANYGRLGSSNTWIGATNQFEDVLFHGTGYFEDILTGQDFQMEPLSNLYLWVSSPAGNNLIWKNYADSIYGIKNWYYDGTKLRLISSGYKWYGRTATTSPFEINSSHFQWTSDKLNLLTSAVMIDSIKHNNVTVGKDSTWIVLGEPVTKWRFLSLKKGFWYNTYSIPDWKWVYTSFNEAGVLQAMDSMMVINEVLEVDNETSVSASYDGTYILIDSLTLPPGKYHIDFGALFVRPDHNDAAQIDVTDTVEIALKEESSAPNTYIKRYVRNIHTYLDTNNLDGDVLNWGAVHTVYSTAKKIYLYGRYLAQALATAIGLGPTVSYTRGRITATLIR